MLHRMVSTGGKRVNDLVLALCKKHGTDQRSLEGVYAALDAESGERHIYGDPETRYALVVIQILAEG